MRKVIAVAVLGCICMFFAGVPAFAANYVTQEVFQGWIDSKKPMTIVDIQPKEDYGKHHFKGSVETNAYPAKTEEEKKRLDAVIEKIKKTNDDVVIICPRGKGGALNTYEYLKQQGVAESRMHILEGGISACPNKDKLEKGR